MAGPGDVPDAAHPQSSETVTNPANHRTLEEVDIIGSSRQSA
jgi:hypothetical protein